MKLSISCLYHEVERDNCICIQIRFLFHFSTYVVCLASIHRNISNSNKMYFVSTSMALNLELSAYFAMILLNNIDSDIESSAFYTDCCYI